MLLAAVATCFVDHDSGRAEQEGIELDGAVAHQLFMLDALRKLGLA